MTWQAILSTHRRMVKAVAGAVALSLGFAAAPGVTAAGGAGRGGGVSTEGVVIVCDGTSAPTRGTYRMNPDGTGLTRIATDIYANDVTRGQAMMTVLMNAGMDIQALRADGVGGSLSIYSSPENDAWLRFSPDGARLAFRTSGSGLPYTVRTADVLRDGSGNVTGLVNLQTVWTAPGQIWGLDFSRDGTMLVVAMSNASGSDLYALHLGDSSVEQVTFTAEREEYPRWSPADDRIAYVARANSGSSIGSLRTIDYTTRAVVTVVAGRSASYVPYTGYGAAWSPGATHLLTAISGKASDLWQFPSTGGTGVNVTTGTSLQLTMPCWGW